MQCNEFTINTSKSKLIYFSVSSTNDHRTLNIKLTLKNTEIEHIDFINVLGLQINSNLKCNTHIEKICKKITSGLFLIRRLSHSVNTTHYFKLLNNLH